MWRRVNPLPRPAATLATNDHITPKQHAVSELNEFNDHIDDASVERVNMRPPSNDALIVLMTPPLGVIKPSSTRNYQVS